MTGPGCLSYLALTAATAGTARAQQHLRTTTHHAHAGDDLATGHGDDLALGCAAMKHDDGRVLQVASKEADPMCIPSQTSLVPAHPKCQM